MKKVKQVLAILAIVFLVGLYVAVFVAAIFDDPKTFTYLKLAITGTVVIPAILWVVGMFLRLARGEGQINTGKEEKEDTPQDGEE